MYEIFKEQKICGTWKALLSWGGVNSLTELSLRELGRVLQQECMMFYSPCTYLSTLLLCHQDAAGDLPQNLSSRESKMEPGQTAKETENTLIDTITSNTVSQWARATSNTILICDLQCAKHLSWDKGFQTRSSLSFPQAHASGSCRHSQNGEVLIVRQAGCKEGRASLCKGTGVEPELWLGAAFPFYFP